MVRLSLLLLLASGCDLVLLAGIDEPGEAACGPYGTPEPLVFDPALEGPQDFSVRNDGSLGAVTARVNGQTHAYVVEQDGEGTWRLHADPARNLGLDSVSAAAISERDLAGDDELYGSTGDPLEPHAYQFTARWGTDGMPVKRDSLFDGSVGNVVEVVDETGALPVAQRKRAVVTLVPVDGVGKNLLLFADLLAPYANAVWDDDPDRTAPINEDLGLSPSQGVLTQDLFTLVYAARRNGGDSDLYVSRRRETDKKWYPGVRIDGVNTDDDELEPWINADCSTLYFQRGDLTYQAQRVDE